MKLGSMCGERALQSEEATDAKALGWMSKGVHRTAGRPVGLRPRERQED